MEESTEEAIEATLSIGERLELAEERGPYWYQVLRKMRQRLLVNPVEGFLKQVAEGIIF